MEELAAEYRTGASTPLDHIAATLEWVNAADPTIRALVTEPDRPGRVEAELSSLPDTASGPLHGVPVVVKDIFAVDGLPTRAGSELPPTAFAMTEAEAVRLLRRAGAVVLGKSVTTEFAFADPGPTANPHQPAHTPGGSSSGSAAAVAAGYAPLALGSQTVDSTLTPAAFCGVVGFKPSFGRASLAGALAFSPAMDHIGIFAQDVAGVSVAAGLVCGEWVAESPLTSVSLAVPTGSYLERVEAGAAAEFRIQLDRLQESGMSITEVPALDDFDALYERHYRLIAHQFAEVHAELHDRFGHLYREKSSALFAKGTALGSAAAEEGMASSAELRNELEALMDDHRLDAWVSPSATGPAPAGLESIGDPAMGLPWTHAHMPTMSIPAGYVDGLPVGLQLAGRVGEDEGLLAISRAAEQALD